MDKDGANAWLDNIRTRCHVEKQAAAKPANDNDWLVKQHTLLNSRCTHPRIESCVVRGYKNYV